MQPFQSTSGLRACAALLLFAVQGLVVGGCSTDASLYPEPAAKPAATPGGILEGFVFDRDTNPVQPIIGAKVYTLPGPEPGARTDAAGFYRISGITPGPYFVVSVDPRGRTVMNEVAIRSGQVSGIDMVYGNGPDGDRLELALLTQFFTPGVNSLATVGPRGAFFRARPLPQLGGNLRSARWSRANTDTVLVISDFESPAGDIYLCNLRDSTTRRLTNNGFPEDSADLSPDGERIVYAVDSDTNGRFEIVTQRLDGTRQVTLVPDTDAGTANTRDSRDSVWAPDGVSIALVTRRTDPAATPFDASYNVAVLPVAAVTEPADARVDQVVATGRLRRLTLDLFDDRNPAWDNEASSLYYDKAEAGHRQLYTVAVIENAAELRLTNDLFENFHPSVSFDGKAIAWISTNTLTGRNADQGAEVFIGEFERKVDRVGGIRNIRQLTETAPTTVNDRVAFRPQYPGKARINDGVLGSSE